ncbi:MAG: PPOX class F420-dependent oxidoreductase [Mycobacterium sp.]
MSETEIPDLSEERFVSLTTFKRNGDAVASPMWIARDGKHLVVWTPADAWKVKRVRHDPRVTISPSNRSGKVRGDAPVVTGTAELLTDKNYVWRARALIKSKYGLQFTIITTIEAIVTRGRKPRVALRITPSTS